MAFVMGSATTILDWPLIQTMPQKFTLAAPQSRTPVIVVNGCMRHLRIAAQASTTVSVMACTPTCTRSRSRQTPLAEATSEPTGAFGHQQTQAPHGPAAIHPS